MAQTSRSSEARQLKRSKREKKKPKGESRKHPKLQREGIGRHSMSTGEIARGKGKKRGAWGTGKL